MIKGVLSTNDGGRFVLLGLSHENLARLVAAEPMVLDLGELGLPQLDGLKFVIIAGSTEQSMLAQIREHIPDIKVRTE